MENLKCHLQCDLCHHRFNPFKRHTKFTWQYDYRGIERVFCQTCSKKEALRATRINEKRAADTTAYPQNSQITVKSAVKKQQPNFVRSAAYPQQYQVSVRKQKQ